MKTVTSERLIFRTLTKEDVSEQYVGWLNDSEINQFLETRFSEQNLETCEQFVTQMQNDSNSFLFGIFSKESNVHMGNIKLGFINNHHGSGQLSLFIGEKSQWGKGLATESIETITKWGFDELSLKRVEAGCYDNNMGSLRAFLKAGYAVEGFFKSSVIFKNKRIGSFWLGITNDG